MGIDRRGPGASQRQYPRLDELEPQRMPDVDQRLDEFRDVRLGVRGVGVMRSRSVPIATVG